MDKGPAAGQYLLLRGTEASVCGSRLSEGRREWWETNVEMVIGREGALKTIVCGKYFGINEVCGKKKEDFEQQSDTI